MKIFSRTLVALIALSLPVPGAAQGSLAPVRELYASASYDEALAALDTMASAGAPSVAVERYRVLCLVALGRTADADRAIERIVRADPFYEIGDEAAPRIRTAFEQVRTRLLPGIVRGIYADGKAAFERKGFAEAAAAFQTVIDLIDTPELINQPGMDDLRMVSAGFRSLARAQKMDSKAPPVIEDWVEHVEPSLPPVSVVDHHVEIVPLPITPPEEKAPNTRAMTVVSSTATLREPVVVEPVPIEQDVPRWSHGELDDGYVPHGVVVVDINEEGLVTSATLEVPIHVLYDMELLDAARTWRFEPARRDGQRVRSRARIELQLQR